MPSEWTCRAFARNDGDHCLRPAFRGRVVFLRQDIRSAQPGGPFDLVLCRNLVFIYFDRRLQQRTLTDIAAQMRPGAALVVGKDEVVPDLEALDASPAGFGVYWKDGAPAPVGG